MFARRHVVCVGMEKHSVLFALLLMGLSLPVLADSLGWPGKTLTGAPCYGRAQGYGPFNYLTSQSKLHVVESNHFTSNVESLTKGESGRIHTDIDYTLRAFPNHHRALWAMSRYYLLKIAGASETSVLSHNLKQTFPPPPECYFNRAKKFAPADGKVSYVYGIYLHKLGKLETALSEYRAAETASPKHAGLNYNLGLLLFDMGNYDEAQTYAERAEKLGYPLRGLQKKLAALDSQSREAAAGGK